MICPFFHGLLIHGPLFSWPDASGRQHMHGMPWPSAFQSLSKGPASPSGNRTPVSRVTGGDTHHYTNEDWLNTVSAHMRAKSGEFYHFLPCGTCFCTTYVVISAFSCHATNIGSIFAWEKTVVVCHCNCVQEKAVAMFWCNMKPESIVEMQRNSQGYKLVLLKPPYGGFEVTQVWHTAPRCYGTHYPLKPSSVPGWARTTNLSVNSRTR